MNRMQWKRLLSLLLMTAALQVPLTGCNTLEGAGQDVEEAGEAVEGAARENRPY